MEPQILSEQVFGFSKQIQLISMSRMESLLNAVDCIEKNTHVPQRAMSIESLLDSNGYEEEEQMAKRRRLDDDRLERTKIRKHNNHEQYRQQRTTITCYHAAVAQKSYGAEKRFLCPPPLVSVNNMPRNDTSMTLVSMAVVCENGERPLEQSMVLDSEQSGSFKYLHVTGAAKAKQFLLRLSVGHANMTTGTAKTSSSTSPYATCFSAPIAIISKPSKKTSKARNVSTCITANSPVSLFNRINSQTVRTKYMTVADDRLCAKNNTWSPFDIIVVSQPECSNDEHNIALPHGYASGTPVSYGSEILLKDKQTGTTSPPMVVCKVDKGFISPTVCCGPISQMQKIALCLASTFGTDQPTYLTASGKLLDNSEPDDSNTTNAATWLDFAPSEWVTRPGQIKAERVQDHLCWTIVGIAQFTHTFVEPATQPTWDTTHRKPPAVLRAPQPSPPPSPPRPIMPFPMVTSVEYQSLTHTIEVVGQHLIQPTTPASQPEFCLGTNGPLAIRHQQLQKDGIVRLSLQMPPSQDLILSNHNQLITRSDGVRYLELPLLLKCQDGTTFPSGKSLACDLLVHHDAARWSVVTSSTLS